jgi:regulatory protein YycI of two-component signal transduction system YycFG
MSNETIKRLTGRYQDWLVNCLSDKNELIAYLKACLEDFELNEQEESFIILQWSLERALEALSKKEKQEC